MPTIDDYRKEAAAARRNLRTEHERTGCPQCAATTDEIIAWLEEPEAETEEGAADEPDVAGSPVQETRGTT